MTQDVFGDIPRPGEGDLDADAGLASALGCPRPLRSLPPPRVREWSRPTAAVTSRACLRRTTRGNPSPDTGLPLAATLFVVRGGGDTAAAGRAYVLEVPRRLT
jgi:hypothetical protein